MQCRVRRAEGSDQRSGFNHNRTFNLLLKDVKSAPKIMRINATGTTSNLPSSSFFWLRDVVRSIELVDPFPAKTRQYSCTGMQWQYIARQVV